MPEYKTTMSTAKSTTTTILFVSLLTTINCFEPFVVRNRSQQQCPAAAPFFLPRRLPRYPIDHDGSSGSFVWSLPLSSSRNDDVDLDDDQEWDRMLQRWKEHQELNEENGCDESPASQSLDAWATEQGLRYQRDTLSVYRLEKLKSAGFINENDVRRKGNADNWESMYEELVAFSDEFGHCDVNDFAKYPALTLWTIGQRERKCRKNLYLPAGAGKEFMAQRIASLDAIGFDWQSSNYFFGDETLWQNKFLELLDYYKAHGHYKVPHFYFENPSLGFFVKSQRSWPTNGAWGEYPKLWKEELDRIGFTWELQG